MSVAVSYVRALRPGLMNEAKIGRSTDDLGWDRPHPEIPTLLEHIWLLDVVGQLLPGESMIDSLC